MFIISSFFHHFLESPTNSSAGDSRGARLHIAEGSREEAGEENPVDLFPETPSDMCLTMEEIEAVLAGTPLLSSDLVYCEGTLSPLIYVL